MGVVCRGLAAVFAFALVACGKRSSPAQELVPAASASVQKPASPGAVRGFRDGDLVFQESMSPQSDMVRALTRSRWTHVGIVFNESAGLVVFEAVSPVRWTPVDQWIERGRNRLYVVKRLRDADARLRPEVIAQMRALASSWVGRPYDVQFRWDDEALYCSELAHKLFERAVGIQLGKVERAADMNLDDELVQRALRSRFAKARFDPAEPVVTPDSIFHDRQLVELRL